MNLNELISCVQTLREVSRNGNTVSRRALLAGISTYGWKLEHCSCEYDYVFSNEKIGRYGFRFECGDVTIRCF